jgi:hypothetical protein
MGKPLPVVVEADEERKAQERDNALRAERRRRLLAVHRVSGWYARADDLHPTAGVPDGPP